MPAARFGANYGYRFEGDAVYLNASLIAASPVDDRRDVQLQLWACPSVPQTVDDLAAGHRVASATLPPLSEIANEHESFGVWAPTRLPAGSSEWVMALALVTPGGERADRGLVHAFVVFPRPERFVLPRLRGVVGFRFTEDARFVTVWGNVVENPRDFANISGTLSLELWALPEPYQGGEFQGAPVAGVELGSLFGGQIWSNVESTLSCEPLKPGRWHLVLMLREWTGDGFSTRDFANFPLPYVVEEPRPAPPGGAAAAVEDAPAAATETQATPTVAEADTVPAAPAAPAAPSAEPGLVSVNTAGVNELKSIKGLSAATARAIVEGRPFASLEQLRQVEGIGPETFAKIRRRLRI